MMVHFLGFVFLPCHPTSQLFCKSLSKLNPNAPQAMTTLRLESIHERAV
jgi:hypothetical protein